MAICNKCGRKYRQNWVRMQPCPQCRKGDDDTYVEVEAHIAKVRVYRAKGYMLLTYTDGSVQKMQI